MYQVSDSINIDIQTILESQTLTQFDIQYLYQQLNNSVEMLLGEEQSLQEETKDYTFFLHKQDKNNNQTRSSFITLSYNFYPPFSFSFSDYLTPEEIDLWNISQEDFEIFSNCISFLKSTAQLQCSNISIIQNNMVFEFDKPKEGKNEQTSDIYQQAPILFDQLSQTSDNLHQDNPYDQEDSKKSKKIIKSKSLLDLSLES